jgi:hypothetical protein
MGMTRGPWCAPCLVRGQIVPQPSVAASPSCLRISSPAMDQGGDGGGAGGAANVLTLDERPGPAGRGGGGGGAGGVGGGAGSELEETWAVQVGAVAVKRTKD